MLGIVRLTQHSARNASASSAYQPIGSCDAMRADFMPGALRSARRIDKHRLAGVIIRAWSAHRVVMPSHFVAMRNRSSENDCVAAILS